MRIGCSGWSYRDWRGALYPSQEPARRWLELYVQRFPTVEVNFTFYRLPRRDAVAHWAQVAPPGFCFALKGSRYLTHIRRLTDLGSGLRRFFEPLEPLREAGCLGPILWQLPESFHRDEDRLAAMLEALPEGRHAFEFRHASWMVPAVRELLCAHDATLVVADDARTEMPPALLDRPTDWRYVRFHYGALPTGEYAPAQLETWARRIGQWRRRGDVYAYFNNDWSAFAPRNALSLMERLHVAW